jgi:hypothetical protein
VPLITKLSLSNLILPFYFLLLYQRKRIKRKPALPVFHLKPHLAYHEQWKANHEDIHSRLRGPPPPSGCPRHVDHPGPSLLDRFGHHPHRHRQQRRPHLRSGIHLLRIHPPRPSKSVLSPFPLHPAPFLQNTNLKPPPPRLRRRRYRQSLLRRHQRQLRQRQNQNRPHPSPLRLPAARGRYLPAPAQATSATLVVGRLDQLLASFDLLLQHGAAGG